MSENLGILRYFYGSFSFLYWSDWGQEGRIERANLDGSERAQYIYTNLAKPWGLTIDYRMHKLYWCDVEYRRIEAVDLLFYKRWTIIADAGQPISLTVFEDSIYWLDGYVEKITLETLMQPILKLVKLSLYNRAHLYHGPFLCNSNIGL